MTVKKIFPWIAALFTVIVWSETFISTKILLEHSLSPAEIFLERFTLAYIGMLPLSHKKLFSDSFRDELKLLAMGIIGGSLYFLAENTALKYSTASNVAILVGTAPLSTALIVGAVYKEEKSSPRQLLGSVITFIGMALVVFNGQFVLHLNPKGDMLAIGASVCWGLYALVLKNLSAKYDTLFITRKVFAYGILSMGVYLLLTKTPFAPLSVLLRPQVWGNLLYLSLIASLLCFIAWNWSITRIGIVRATNLIYGQCLFTMAFAAVILGERITPMVIIGTLVLIFGMILALNVSDDHRKDPARSKRDLRRSLRDISARLTPVEKETCSERIWAQIEARGEFVNASTVLIYMSLADEVITEGFIRRWHDSKRFVIPLVDGDCLRLFEYSPEHIVSGYRGIAEPSEDAREVAPGEIDLAIIPGAAFAPCPKGGFHRLGRGGGFYDRLLPQLDCPTFGVAFSHRHLPSLPIEEWDATVDFAFKP